MKLIQSKVTMTIVTLLIVLALSWWHSVMETADNPLSRQAEVVRESVKAEDWETAKKEVVKLRNDFEDKRWMLELFGPTEHVTVTRYHIISLVEAVHQEKEGEAKQLLGKIKGRFNEFVIF